jgi:hypothetical protein
MLEPRVTRYVIPFTAMADLVIAGLVGGKRRFRAHALKMIAGTHPPLRVLGEEYVPCEGPGLITVNHYHSPAFWTPWFTAAISALVPVDIHWVIAEAWTYPGQRLGGLKRSLSRWILTHVARVYGFTSMPPMPPAADEVLRRSAAIKRLMNYARCHPQAFIGIAPEGGDQPGAVLKLPPCGFGKLALTFSHMGILFYPAGVYEENGVLFLHFGPPYRLEIEKDTRRDQLDLVARRLVMKKIAACLPNRLRGEFGTE